mgnify:CR=1 FL=1
MSDAGIPTEIPIEITPQRMDTVNNKQRQDTLLRGREIMQYGEADNRFRKVIFLEEAFKEMVAWGMSDRSTERGGVLFGFHNGDQTIITRFIGSQIAEGTAGSINITSEAWADLHRRNDAINRQSMTNDEMMAWFHTHPSDYPPTPLTTDDRETMSRHFSESDKNSPADRSTIIMTTYSGQPSESIAMWKWKADQESAVLVNGIAIAVKNNQAAPQTSYYAPSEASSRVVKPETESIEIDVDDLDETTGFLNIQDKGLSIKQDPKTEVITVQLEDEAGKLVTLNLEDLAPEPEVIQVSLDEVTPDRAKALIGYLNKNPDGRGNKVIRKILKAVKAVLPPDMQADVDLGLQQTKSIDEQIKII